MIPIISLLFIPEELHGMAVAPSTEPFVGLQTETCGEKGTAEPRAKWPKHSFILCLPWGGRAPRVQLLAAAWRGTAIGAQLCSQPALISISARAPKMNAVRGVAGMAAAGFHSSGLAVSLVLPCWCRGMAVDAVVVSSGLALIGNHLSARPKPGGASEKSCVSTTCNYGFCLDELPASSWDGARRVAAICQGSALGSTSRHVGTEAESLLKEAQKRVHKAVCPLLPSFWGLLELWHTQTSLPSSALPSSCLIHIHRLRALL